MSQASHKTISLDRLTAQDKRKGGGRKFTALLALLMTGGAMALMIGVIWLTEAKIMPHDELSRFAPSNVAAYVHADLTAPVSANFESTLDQFLLPENLQADEAAKIIIYDRETKQAHYGTLVAWRGRRVPDDAEMELMTALDAYKLTTGVYLISDAELAAKTLAAYQSHLSLAEDRRITRALAMMRRLYPIQAYVNPIAVPGVALNETGGWLKSIEPSVIGLINDRNGLLAMAAPVSLAASQSSWLGLSPTLTVRQTPTTAPQAILSVFAERNPLDPMTALFAAVDERRSLMKLPEDDRLAVAKNSLRQALGGNTEVTLMPTNGNNLAYIARFPNLRPTTLKAAITDYVNAALPETVALSLPDADYLNEFRYNDKNFAFQNRSGDQSVEYLELFPGQTRYFVASDGGGGSVLTTDAALLAYRNERPAIMAKNRCSAFAGTYLFIGNQILKRLISANKLFTDYFGLNKLVSGLWLVENNDNLLISCGY